MGRLSIVTFILALVNNHPQKTQNFMLDVTYLVIQDGESISQERFDSVPATTIELLKMEAGKYLEYVKGKYVVN